MLKRVAAAVLVAVMGVLPAESVERVRRLAIERPADDPAIAPGHVRIIYSGVIVAPLSRQLAEFWSSEGNDITEVTLELDSPGGSLNHSIDVVDVLRTMRKTAKLTTLVKAGSVCASSCVLLFMQGEVRRASTASAWMFHGACGSYTNVPSAAPTRLYLDMLVESGLDKDFACELEDKGYLSLPGAYWFSGYELQHVQKTGVITDFIGGWEPADPLVPPFDPNIRPR